MCFFFEGHKQANKSGETTQGEVLTKTSLKEFGRDSIIGLVLSGLKLPRPATREDNFERNYCNSTNYIP